MSFTRAEWTAATLASRGEQDDLVAEIEQRIEKLALPLTPARTRANVRHRSALAQLRGGLDEVSERLATRNRILAAAGVGDPDGMDDTTATSTIALLRFQAGQG